MTNFTRAKLLIPDSEAHTHPFIVNRYYPLFSMGPNFAVVWGEKEEI